MVSLAPTAGCRSVVIGKLSLNISVDFKGHLPHFMFSNVTGSTTVRGIDKTPALWPQLKLSHRGPNPSCNNEATKNPKNTLST
ncbi:hypothetical protein JOB18_023226 [Solea senegalensis]|uniref:Uncharacterized protein n=1 Tax=Solea senegalensis TaxID=28829 RepID=A0AAV6SIN9_SOLSE|nr:hypothetical protein JOB18_023226 [Solea senegalensis]